MARILVVEDREANRYVIASWLQRAGFEVIEAATGQEALARIAPEVDVVVLDVHLPDMSGFDVCTAIKTAPATASVAVMHMSATAIDPTSRTQGLDRGADAYLIEPVDPDEFLSVVRSLVRARSARRTADDLIDRLGRLAAAALPLNAADSVPRLLEAAAAGAADIFDAPTLAVADMGGHRAARVLVAGRGAAPQAEPYGQPLTSIWKGGPGELRAEDTPPAWQPLLERSGAAPAAWYVTPFIDEAGLPGGGLAIALPSPEATLPAEDKALARQLTDAINVALTNLRAFAEEHRIALMLQRALLPERLPDVPGLSFAARYIAASNQLSVGGDFYDAFVLPTGETAVVVGDVQGHSLRAATIMAELRYSLRAYLVEGHPPAVALNLLNELVLVSHPSETTTVAVLVVNPEGTEAVLANAGHLPPLVATSSGVTLVDHHGPLLGVSGVEQSSVTMPLDEGALVVLATDGLIERRGSSLDDGLAKMAEVVAATSELDEEQIADALVEQLAGGADDDIAVLVLRRRGH